MIKLSIITINYNNGAGLKKTFESVINQSFKDFEYIVIDGGSTDGSVEIIRENEPFINYWVSETDNGIYHAMNKGIANAKGEYLLMVNSGDYLINNTALDNVFTKSDLKDIVYGDIIWIEENKQFRGMYPEELTFQFFRNNSLPHQATFVHKNVYQTIGVYDENYKIISDWKFFLLAVCKFNISYQHISLVITACDRYGISCRPENEDEMLADKNAVLQKEFGSFISDYIQLDRLQEQLKALNNSFLIRLNKKMFK
jgi:glycosyltransferase involved in cell wall biosynthesis